MNYHSIKTACVLLLGIITIIGESDSLLAQVNAPGSGSSNFSSSPAQDDYLTQFYGNKDKNLIYTPWLLPEIDTLSWRVAMGKVRNRIETKKRERFNGIAYNGLVGGDILHQDLQAALVDSYRIDQNFWLGKALFNIANYLSNKGDKQATLDLLEEVVFALDSQIQKTSEGQNQETHAELSDLIYQVAMILLKLDKTASAMDLISRIPDESIKSKALRDSALRAIDYSNSISNNRDNDIENRKNLTLNAIKSTLEFANNFPYDNKIIGQTILDMVDSLLILKENNLASTYIQALLPKVLASSDDEKDAILARLAANLIRLNNAKQSMELLRSIKDKMVYTKTLASIAAARGEIGDTEAMTPLFILAREEINQLPDEINRMKARRHLMIELTRVGRLADAFSEAGKITDKRAQALAIADMAQYLLDHKNYEATRSLLDYIQPWSLRLPLYSGLARDESAQGNRIKASEYLLQGLEPGNTPKNSPMIPRQVGGILTLQSQYGDQSKDQEIIEKARKIIDAMPNELIKIDGLVRLAIAEANLEQLESARQSLTSAYRLTFDNSQNPSFAKALETVSFGMVMTGDLLSAFDAAARIPLPPTIEEEKEMRRTLRRQVNKEYELPKPLNPNRPMDTPRYAALARIASAAARVGEMEIALRSADMIESDTGQATAYAVIGAGLGSRKQTMREVLNEVASVTDLSMDVWLSPSAATWIENEWQEDTAKKNQPTAGTNENTQPSPATQARSAPSPINNQANPSANQP